MSPEYPQATVLARRETVAKPTTAGAESEATKGPPERGHAGRLAGSQIPATAAAIDFAEATPIGRATSVNAVAVDSNQQISLGEATTTEPAAVDNTSVGSGLQSLRGLKWRRAESDGRNALLFGQGGRFASGEEAENARANHISDADLGTPRLKASQPPEEVAAEASSPLSPDTTAVAASKQPGSKRLGNDWLGPPSYDPDGKKGPASVVKDAGDQIFKQNEARPGKPRAVFKDVDGADALTSQTQFVEEPEELRDCVADTFDSQSVQSDDDFPTVTTLSGRLFDALEETYNYKSDSKRFLPKKKLKSLITVELVTDELKSKLWTYMSVSRIRELARRVCEEKLVEIEQNGKSRRVLKSFRQIFAILLLCGKAETIDKFLGINGHGELSDLDLPLVEYRRQSTRNSDSGSSCSNSRGKGALQLRKKDEKGHPTRERLRCFEGWDTISLDFFHEKQWLLLAPYFSRDRDGRVRHWELMDRHILPFVSGPGERRVEDIDGGYAKVFMVNIHRDHQYFDDPTPTREFAIKQLKSYDMAQFRREVDILKKFSEHRRDPHIVSLLATYEHCQKLHMVFHRAEGNLHQYWTELNPKPEFTYKNVLWMSRQITGVTNGLLRLHRHYTEKPMKGDGDATDENSKLEGTLLVSPSFDSVTDIDYLTMEQNDETVTTAPQVRIIEPENAGLPPASQIAASPDTGTRSSECLALPHKEEGGTGEGILQYGRHTDITPNNILWYDNQPCEEGGVLKVADFGQSEFHSDQSKTHIMSNSKVEGWLPYRPPECDLSRFVPQFMNQAYDIWSLGCVFLEFVTWMLGGAELFNDFATKRSSLDIRCAMKTVVFFELRLEDENAKTPKVELKPEVEDFIDDLHGHKNCTEYFHQLLDIIENNMLKVNPRERMGCRGIAQKLEKLHAKCSENSDFASSPNPWCGLRTRQRQTPTVRINPANNQHQALILRCAAVFQNFGHNSASPDIDTQKKGTNGEERRQ